MSDMPRPDFRLQAEHLANENARLRAEIERLRETNDLLRLANAAGEQFITGERTRLRADIDRLRDLLVFNGIDPDATIEAAKGAASAIEVERLRAAGNNAFMAMCAYRDTPDIEVFQDAIDALGTALFLPAGRGNENDLLEQLRADDQAWEAEARACHKLLFEKDAEIAQLRAERESLLKVLAKARGPEGHTAEKVAEWLRSRGYVVALAGKE